MSYQFSWRQPLIPRRNWPTMAQLFEGFVQWMTIVIVTFAVTITWKLSLVFMLMYLAFHAWFSTFIWFRNATDALLEHTWQSR